MHDRQIAAMRIVGVVILLAGAALLLGAGLGEPTDRSRSLSRSYKNEVHDTFDYSFRLQTWLFGRPPFAPPAFGPSDHPHAWRITPDEPDPGLDVALAEGPRLPLLVAMRGSVLAVMAAYGLTDDADDAGL